MIVVGSYIIGGGLAACNFEVVDAGGVRKATRVFWKRNEDEDRGKKKGRSVQMGKRENLADIVVAREPCRGRMKR